MKALKKKKLDWIKSSRIQLAFLKAPYNLELGGLDRVYVSTQFQK